ncbi:MAG: MFS transporter [Ruminococcaceae bacterium]|nr:MFS transporter [Oscillospiraceae bacterium]
MNKIDFSKRNWTVLVLFGLIGQIAWSVENMYFNLFLFETVAPSLQSVTLMVQLSGVVATVVTLVSGTLSDKVGNRRTFISIGYIIWGITVALFGFLSTDLTVKVLGLDSVKAVSVTLGMVIAADCIMTLFGSTANDAGFNAWVTDNTKPQFRGTVEAVVAILPLIAMLIVAGGFGIIVSVIGYKWMFFSLGIVISLCGVVGCFIIKDSKELQKNGTLKDIFFGFKPSVIKGNSKLYKVLLIVGIYGIACQVFMPYLIIYMKEYLGFSVVEYSIVFGFAIIVGAVINLYLGRLSDRKNKSRLLYLAAAVMAVGLAGMYICRFGSKLAVLLTFGVAGFVMITGYIFVSALCGSMIRDNTPENDAGKLQGVRMVFSVLIPMLVGPMIGNAVNKLRNIPLPDMSSADTMTTEYIPAPEIFLVGAILMLATFLIIPTLKTEKENAIKN